MADNYLEKKMEELRTKGFNNCSKRRTGRKAKEFKAKRIVIIPPVNIKIELALQIEKMAEQIVGLGAKTAIATCSENAIAELIPQGQGIRKITANKDKLGIEIIRLYDSWLGIDVIISMDKALGDRIIPQVKIKKQELPSTSFYQSRLIEIDEETIAENRLPEEEIISLMAPSELNPNAENSSSNIRIKITRI